MAAYIFNSIDDSTFEFNGRVFPRYFEVLNGTATGIAIKSVFTHEPFLSFNKISEIEIDGTVYTEAQIIDALNALTEVVGFRMGGIGGAVVESVTGNLVDNTDPANPVVTGVETVTGNIVDNTDPFNPVVTGIDEAPIDGTVYSRTMGVWVPNPVQDPTPEDLLCYVMCEGLWTELPQTDWNAVTGYEVLLNKPTDVTDLSVHSVTELNDVTDAGSGAIITVAERGQIAQNATDITDLQNNKLDDVDEGFLISIDKTDPLNPVIAVGFTIGTGLELTGGNDLKVIDDLIDGGDSTSHFHASDRDRANHTGTQTASTISDFDTEVSNNPDVVANTAKVSFPEAPNDGEEYVRKNLAWAIASKNHHVYYAESLGESSTDSETFQNKVTLSETVAAGDYFVEVSYVWRFDHTSHDFRGRITIDNVLQGQEHRQEPKDAGSDQRHLAFRRYKVTLTAGSHDIDLDYCTSDDDGTAYIYDASITLTPINIL